MKPDGTLTREGPNACFKVGDVVRCVSDHRYWGHLAAEGDVMRVLGLARVLPAFYAERTQGGGAVLWDQSCFEIVKS